MPSLLIRNARIVSEGRRLQGRVDVTIVGSGIAWQDGRLADVVGGRRVESEH